MSPRSSSSDPLPPSPLHYHAMDYSATLDGSSQELELEDLFPYLKHDLSERDGSSGVYHDLYLQKNALEMAVPIMFEDGMDYIECQLYYQNIESQHRGGAPRRHSVSKQNSNRDLRGFKMPTTANLVSCLRRTKPGRPMLNKRALSERILRRCSFSGIPGMNENDDSNNEAAVVRPTPLRSHSLRAIDEVETNVSFEQYVQVVTIHPVADYPPTVRANLWMTRDELAIGVRRAALEAQQRQRKSTTTSSSCIARSPTLHELQQQLCVVDAQESSATSVIGECLKAMEDHRV